MKSTRMEAFSDGVIAVIITIMVLELHVPRANGLAGLWSMAPRLAVYLLSFLIIGIYWINHHELIRRTDEVDYRILWANLIFLFVLSLIPFFVDYLDEKLFDTFSTVLYAVMRRQWQAGALRPADLAEQWKHGVSLGIYLVAIALAFYRPWLSLAVSGLVTLVWIIPGTLVKTCDENADLPIPPPDLPAKQ